MNRKKQGFAALFILVSVLLTGCRDAGTPPPSGPEQETKGTFITMPAPEVPKIEIAYTDPLTGKKVSDPKILTRRPFAVAVNNIEASLPQAGVSRAAIIYELEAEGVTRLLCVYNDYEVQKIGSVRSARHYFMDYAFAHGAIFVHWGGSPQAYEYIKKTKINEIDGINYEGAYFYRDKERRQKGYDYEHTGFTDLPRLLEGAAKRGYETELKSPAGTYFLFSNAEVLPREKDGAYGVEAKFPGVTAKYTYEESDKKYYREQYGKKHIDETTGNQLAFDNVFVIYTDIKNIKGDDKGRLDVRTSGRGEALYITRGGYAKVEWVKDSKDAKLSFVDAAGKEIKVNAGNSIVEVFSNKREVKLSPKPESTSGGSARETK